MIVSPDKSKNEAPHINAALCLYTTASFLHFLSPSPPTLLPPFLFPSSPSCPEVIFVGIVVELHCVGATQSWDFMMQPMSKISKEQKRAFSKCSRYHRGSYMWGICHHMIRRGPIMIQAHRERARALRYDGSKGGVLVSGSMKRGICLMEESSGSL